MNTRTAIRPFWQRLRAIALYPFQGAALVTIVVLVGVMALLGWLPVMGFILVIVCWLAAYKYAFEILQETAHGKLEPPERVLQIEGSVVFQYIALQIVLLIGPLIVMVKAPLLGLILLIGAVLVQPVATMVLAMSESLGQALSPGRWLAVIARIGWPYLAVVGLLFVIQVSASNAGALLAQVLPLFVAGPLVNVFSLWGLFATFHLMGYLIYQYHEQLGFDPAAVAGAPAPLRNRDQDLLDQAGAQIQAGDPAQAMALLREEMRERAVSPEVHELYRRLLRQAGDHAALVEHGRLFLHLLLMEKRERRALGLARECLDLDADFTTPEPEDGARLAERAALAGQSALAVDLLRAAIRKHPRNPQMPAWSLRAADLMLRQPGMEGEARALLVGATERADEATRQRIEQLMATLPAI
ncbi:MAG TPA: hypothetical protein PKZ76_04410 [Xanthomonadaceae bacterium]|nr:hypothetical protein [Xanthomonadaceae bacterium]